jgi:hypothetical protein
MSIVLLAAWRGRPGPLHTSRPAVSHRPTTAAAPRRRPEGQALLAGAPPLPPLSDDTTADPDAPLPHAPQARDEETALEACGWHDSSWALLQGLIVVEGPPGGHAPHPEMMENAAYPAAFCRVLQTSA